jgi:hypothetical protein
MLPDGAKQLLPQAKILVSFLGRDSSISTKVRADARLVDSR